MRTTYEFSAAVTRDGVVRDGDPTWLFRTALPDEADARAEADLWLARLPQHPGWPCLADGRPMVPVRVAFSRCYPD